MQKKFQVFVSSTYTDLIDERQDILKAILDLSHIPAGMEGFHAADQEQLSYIKKIIDECDYYILVIAGRYGSVDEQNISYTEREFEYAVGKGINVLAFIHSDVRSLPVSKVDTDQNAIQRLDLFKNKVKQKRLVSFWKTKDELRSSVIISLSKSFAETPGLGWVRGNAAASDEVLRQLNNARNELDQLRTANIDLRSQLQPSVQNIASLSETFDVRYEYFIYEQRGKKVDILCLTWTSIFSLLAPSFFAPQGEFLAKTSKLFEIYIRDNTRLNYSHVFLRSEDIDTIKVQMNAYGLLRTYQAGTVSGGVSEFTELTDFGKRMLTEIRTVKTSI